MSVSPITPVTLLTGFLGSGKTTLLNRILTEPEYADTAVLINEFGEVGLDHLLVRKSSENIVVMPNGCICCTVAGDLIKTLRDLYVKRAQGSIPVFRRVVIETTGLADPAPIMTSMIEIPMTAARYSLAGVITTVDVTHIQAALDAQPECVKQIAVADRIVLTKTDLADVATVNAAVERVQHLNPAAIITDVQSSGATRIFDNGVYQLNHRTPQVQQWLKPQAYRQVSVTHTGPNGQVKYARKASASNHDASIQSFVLVHETSLDWSALQEWLNLLLSTQGAHILRMKAIVNVHGGPAIALSGLATEAATEATTTAATESKFYAPLVLHAVHHTLYPSGRLSAWPEGFEDRVSRFVFITRNLSEEYVLESFDAFVVQHAQELDLTRNPHATFAH